MAGFHLTTAGRFCLPADSYLRRIVNQRHVPDDARVTVDAERITIEWADA